MKKDIEIFKKLSNKEMKQDVKDYLFNFLAKNKVEFENRFNHLNSRDYVASYIALTKLISTEAKTENNVNIDNVNTMTWELVGIPTKKNIDVIDK